LPWEELGERTWGDGKMKTRRGGDLGDSNSGEERKKKRHLILIRCEGQLFLVSRKKVVGGEEKAMRKRN